MKINLNNIFILTAVLVLLVGLSAVGAADANQNTTSIADNHADIEQVTTSHAVKEDTNIVSANEKLINSDKKVNTEKKSQKALKSSNQELNYYVSSTGSDSNTGTSSSPYKTINRAISQATSDNNIYNIHVKEGTYTGTGNTNLTVNGNRHINFIGDGVNKTVLDGQVNYTVGSGTVWGNDPYFNPYTITYGNWGMNITSGNGSITIQNMNIQNMLSAGGSSINAYPTATVDNYGNLSVDNVYFYNNLAGVGAGIRNNNDATLTVTDSIFEANRKSSTTGNFGAGIYNNGTADVYNTQFIGNIARWGTVTNDKLINITNCTFRDGIAYNAASNFKFGSGIATNTGTADYWNTYESTAGLVTNVINSTFINNQQTDIYQGKGNLLVDNCNFENSTGVYIAGESVNNASLSHTIKNSNFNNMISSSISLSLGNNKNITFAIYNQGQSTTTITGNNITTGTDAYGLYLRSNNNVTDNHINGYVYIKENNNTLTNNTIIISNRTYTVELKDDAENNNISKNYLYTSIYKGNESVKGNRSTNIISGNEPNDTSNEIRIDEENYLDYFDTEGNINTNTVTNGTTVKLGQLSGKQLKIDNVNIYLTSYNSAQLTDCSITVGENSLVTINGLNINNTDNNTVITLNSQYNTVESNTITTTATNPIKINANNNELKDNTITANGNEVIGILVTSANNNIEENSITVNGTGLINAITVTETADNTIINNTINAQSTEDATAININKSDKNTIRNNDINIKATNNATAINIEESDENMINSPVTINSKTAQAVTIQNSNNNTINGITTDITATNANAIKLYKTNNTIITANDTTNIYTIDATTSNMINIEQSNNTEISYITPRIYGSGTAINITGSYNTTIEAVNCTNTTTSSDNRNVQYVNAENSNTLYIGRIVRDNFTQSAIINTTAYIVPISIGHTSNIEINGMEIYTNSIYTMMLHSSNNILVANNVLVGHRHASKDIFIPISGDDSIGSQNNQNITFSGNTGIINTTKYMKRSFKTLKREGNVKVVSVNNNAELLEVITATNSTANSIIININDFSFNPNNPDDKEYSFLFSDYFYKNITINGNNQTFNQQGQPFVSGYEASIITINDVMIINSKGVIDEWGFSSSIILNNITFENNTDYILYVMSGEAKLTNCTIKNNTGKLIRDDLVLDANFIIDNCYINGSIPENFLTVITHNSSIDLQAPRSVVPGSSVLINGTLLNDMGGPGKGLNVTLFVDGDEVANVTTDDNGKFNYTYTPKSIKSGINVTARFNGTDYHNYGYNASEGSTTFDVTKISTDLSLDAINTTTPEENITITGKLFEKDTNNTLGNTNVTIVSNGKTYNVKTDENGTFTQVITSPSTTGTFDVTVTYNGSDMYDTSSATVNYTVRKISTNLTVDTISTVKVGSNITVTGKLLDETNTALTNTTVTIITSNTTFNITTDANGLYNTSIPVSNVGLFNITLSYAGNNKYTGNNVTTTFNVEKHDTVLTVEPISTVKVGDNITVTGKLLDETNTTVTGAVISIVNGNTTVNTTTDANGLYIISIPTNTAGTFTVTLTYDSNDNYEASNVTTTYTVTKVNTTVTIDPINGVLGRNVSFVAHVVDENNQTVTGGYVIFKVNGVTLKDTNNTPIQVNVTNGIATLNTTATWSTAKNTTVIYSGNDAYSDSRMDEGSITLAKQNVTVNVSINDNLKPGDNLIVIVNITDNDNNTVNAGKVVFKLNGKTLENVNVTNGQAVLNYTIPENYSPKTYNITVIFAGSIYNRADVTNNISLSALDANLALNVTSENLKPGSQLIAVTNITDLNGNPVNRGKVLFKLNGKTLKDENNQTIEYNVTNGQAVLNYTIPTTYSAKTYNLTAVFGGSNYNTVRVTQNITLQKTNIRIDAANVTINRNLVTVKANIINNETNTTASERPIKVSVKLDQRTIIKQAIVNNGIIDLNTTLNYTPTGNHTVEIVSGENGLYNTGRLNVTI